ncbi:MAG: hypothetical protein M5U12_29995 [Verrucomicrobia bacterium]|nr:hypothetical protein [Verrucomicrobiota bacterium]
MFPSVNTSDVGEVQREVVRLFQEMFPGEDPHLIECAFEHLATCFSGGNPKYQRIDVRYHDLEHTLQGDALLGAPPPRSPPRRR